MAASIGVSSNSALQPVMQSWTWPVANRVCCVQKAKMLPGCVSSYAQALRVGPRTGCRPEPALGAMCSSPCRSTAGRRPSAGSPTAATPASYPVVLPPWPAARPGGCRLVRAHAWHGRPARLPLGRCRGLRRAARRHLSSPTLLHGPAAGQLGLTVIRHPPSVRSSNGITSASQRAARLWRLCTLSMSRAAADGGTALRLSAARSAAASVLARDTSAAAVCP